MSVFSLIVPTIHRTWELSRFLESISRQKMGLLSLRQVEIILVDQNKDDRLSPLLKPYHKKFKIKHFRRSKTGVSNAKNFGLSKIRGKYVAFPDDDCFYERNTLKRVFSFFLETGEKQAIFARGLDPKNRKETLRYPKEERLITSPRDPDVFWGIQWAQFFTADMVRAIGKFDENFGIGSRWGSGEETDFAIRCLKKDYPIRFVPDILIFHHRVVPETMKIEKIRGYALGFGALCRKQRMTRHFIWKSVKQAAGAIFLILLGRGRASKICAELMIFRLKGYWEYG